MKGEVRRRQIVEVALRLVSEHGVQGATLNRIAREVGMTTAGLYGHFKNRREILLAVMDVVFERVQALHRSASNPNALERLRESSIAHTRAAERFAAAAFEFVAAPPGEGIREVWGEKTLTLIEELAEIVREGQAQGTIRKDADCYYVAWMLVGWGWTKDVSSLMGISSHWMGPRSERMLNEMLEEIRNPE